MIPRSIRPEHPLDPRIVDILRSVAVEAQADAVAYMLLGATARDILVTHAFGLATRRAVCLTLPKTPQCLWVTISRTIHPEEVTMLMSSSARFAMRITEKKIMKYYDDGGRPGRGNCTWGVGIKAHNGPCSKAELARVVTDTDVEREFARRLTIAERGVEKNIDVALTQAQFDGLVSFAYNVGVGGASKVFRLVNNGEFDAAAAEIMDSTHGHIRKKGKRVTVFYPGLVPRRVAESAPFRNVQTASTAK